MEKPVILFDGICNLCNSAVGFIIKHDKKNVFRFALLQSATGANLLAQYNLPVNDLNSFILIENNKVYSRSTAALRTAKKLNGILPWLYTFMIIPKIFRDSIYDWIAANRYKWFGKKEECMIPTQELKARFLS